MKVSVCSFEENNTDTASTGTVQPKYERLIDSDGNRLECLHHDDAPFEFRPGATELESSGPDSSYVSTVVIM